MVSRCVPLKVDAQFKFGTAKHCHIVLVICLIPRYFINKTQRLLNMLRIIMVPDLLFSSGAHLNCLLWCIQVFSKVFVMVTLLVSSHDGPQNDRPHYFTFPNQNNTLRHLKHYTMKAAPYTFRSVFCFCIKNNN